jgi:hypothetical protein
MKRALAVAAHHRKNKEHHTDATRVPGAILLNTRLLLMEEWDQATILLDIRTTSLTLIKKVIREHTDERTSGAKTDGKSGRWEMTTLNSSRRRLSLGISS